MRRRTPREPRDDELTMAVGLVWGHLHAQQPEDAYLLATGCQSLWPDDPGLALLAAYAATEVDEPVDVAALRRSTAGMAGMAEAAGTAGTTDDAGLASFIALVERRSTASSI